jgi:hypothetical protein
MSRCLTDSELQAIADNEAQPNDVAHAEQCPRCGDRLAARVRLIARAVDAAGTGDLPPGVRQAARTRLVGASTAGATTLRPVRTVPKWAWAIPLAAAAAIALIVIVLPGVDRRTTVSAAEILGRSRTALAAATDGVEVLTYDLELAGVLADLIPEEQSGRFTVQELVDHDHEGRYRIVKLDGRGQIVGGAADDPLRGTRVRYMRANGRGFLLRFQGAEPTALSLPALKRTALQTLIGIMQASSSQTLQQVPCANDACYRVDIPANGMPAGALVALENAHAIITMAEARIVEFSASGRVAERPFTIDFALRSRELRPASSAQDADFDIAPQPGDVVLQGNASNNPVWDVVARALGAIPDQGSGSSETGTSKSAARERR